MCSTGSTLLPTQSDRHPGDVELIALAQCAMRHQISIWYEIDQSDFQSGGGTSSDYRPYRVLGPGRLSAAIEQVSDCDQLTQGPLPQ